MKNTPLKRVAEIFGIACGQDMIITGYQIDSRKVEKGTLFFAISGAKVDGHVFLEEVKKRGAVAAVVDQEYAGEDFGLFLIRVEKVQKALHFLAKTLMQKNTSFLIGITGSVGKTTVKDFTAILLEGKYRVGKTLFSENSKLSYPLTLLNRKGNEEVLVLELGMSEPNDLASLVGIVGLDLAILTKVAYAHGGNFERGILDIAKYKAQIFSHPKTKICLFDEEINGFSEAISQMHGEKSSFSTKEKKADFFFSNGAFYEKGKKVFEMTLPFKESHLLHNLIASIAIARKMGLLFEEIADRISKLQVPKMRFEKIERNRVLFINDAYNANPESMKAALLNLPKPQRGGKVVAVLGAMAEMGKEHDIRHKEVGELAKTYVDHLFVFGKEALPIALGFEGEKCDVFFNMEEMAQKLEKILNPGDVVLLKASRFVELEKLLEKL